MPTPVGIKKLTKRSMRLAAITTSAGTPTTKNKPTIVASRSPKAPGMVGNIVIRMAMVYIMIMGIIGGEDPTDTKHRYIRNMSVPHIKNEIESPMMNILWSCRTVAKPVENLST